MPTVADILGPLPDDTLEGGAKAPGPRPSVRDILGPRPKVESILGPRPKASAAAALPPDRSAPAETPKAETPEEKPKGFPYDDPNKEYGQLLPVAYDKTTDKLEFSTPEILRSAARGYLKLKQLGPGFTNPSELQKDDDIAAFVGMATMGEGGLAKAGTRGVKAAKTEPAAKGTMPPAPSPPAAGTPAAAPTVRPPTSAPATPKSPLPDLLPAIQKPDGKIVTGQAGENHIDIEGITRKDRRGFVGSDGKFLNRQDAAKIMRAAGADVPDRLSTETLNSAHGRPMQNPRGPATVVPRPPVEPNAASAGPLSHAPALDNTRAFEDQLHQLTTLGQADKLEIMKRLKALPDGVKPETFEKLYHYEESLAPGKTPVHLTAEEQALYDTHIKPMAAEADRLSAELERLGYPVDKIETKPGKIAAIDKTTGELSTTQEGERLPSSTGYTPRYVSGRTRSFGEVLDQWKQGVEAKFGGAPGRSMRKTVDAGNRRKFYVASGPGGEQRVVYVAPGGDVLPFGENVGEHQFDLGKMGTVSGEIRPGTKFKDGSKQTWKLDNATTHEIEAVANVRYSKNLMANRLDNLAKLRAATRNAKFLEGMKNSPDWNKVAVKVGDVDAPPVIDGRQWKVVDRPLQLRGYYMEPRLAHALEDFGKTANRDAEGLTSGLDKMANVVKGSIFWWPLPHMLNTFDHYITAGGLVGNVKGLVTGSSPRAMIKAIRAVATQNDDYMRVLKAGGSLPYAKVMTEDFHRALVARLGEAVKTDPGAWQKMSSIFGYANPIHMIKGIYGASSRALWSSTDAMNLARIFEEEERLGLLDKAIKHVEEHMPNYRIPSEVAGSRLVSEVLQNPLATMFGRYQYNRLASYGHMVRQLTSKLPMQARMEALDKLAMLGVLVFAGYPLVDKAVQKITGNPNAEFRRFGSASVPQAGLEVLEGKKSPHEALPSVLSLGPLGDAIVEGYYGRYGYSGQPVARWDDAKRGHEQFLFDLFRWIGTKIQPVGQAEQILSGRRGASQLGESMFGIKDPTTQQVEQQKKMKQREHIDAIKRDKREALKRHKTNQQAAP